MASLILHELTPSPNNVKVRIALGYKGLDYERKPLELTEFPGDRSSVVALSGQPRLPVLQHGDAIIPDSTAILRYLDANFRETPSLGSGDFAEFGEIEQWEVWRMSLGPAIGPIFPEVVGGGGVKPETAQACSAALNEVTAALEAALASSDYLVGNRMTSADCHVAPMINLGCLTESMATISPFYAAFRASLDLGPGRDRVRAWVTRVLAHDAVMQSAGASA